MVVRTRTRWAVTAGGMVAAAMALAAGLAPAMALAAPSAAGRTPVTATETRITVAGEPLSADRPAIVLQAPRVPAKPAKPVKPNAVQIVGKVPGGRITIRAQEDPELFANLLGQVSWLVDAAPQTKAPAPKKLGQKFTLVVLTRDNPQQTYDVYPLAAGGPRVYRPAKQPDLHRTKAGWFYGQLSMSESLRMAGAPLPEKRDSASGGIGGGERISRSQTMDPAAGVTEMLAQLHRLLLLNGAVALTIAIGLGCISYLIRRKV